MGEVYRARDPRLEREVALKILPEAFAADPARVERFEREARLLASLNHPHIAPCMDSSRVTRIASWCWSWCRGRRWPIESSAARSSCARP